MFNCRLVFIMILTTLTFCTAPDLPKYDEMSEFDLIMHNALLPENEQIICQEEITDWVGGTFRRIPRRCFTVGQLKQLQREAEYSSNNGGSASRVNPNAGSVGGSASGASGF